jgi:hypothetical protein
MKEGFGVFLPDRKLLMVTLSAAVGMVLYASCFILSANDEQLFL